MPPTVCLAAIVKDEAENVDALAACVLPHVDRYVIVDTGSTDGTVEAIREAFSSIPGRVHRTKWEGFGPARTELMRHARAEADWLLLLDADMRPRFPKLDLDGFDCWHGRILGPVDYTLPILVRGDLPWKYEGVAHSYLACDEPFTESVLDGLEIEDLSHTTIEKLRGDLELLSVEHARNPLDARTAFYLAQTYQDLDMIPEAIAAYRARAALDGWAEENYVARQRLGALLVENVSFAEGAIELLKAWETRPSRAEALRALANSANSVADKIPYPSDRLFVRRDAYRIPEPTPLPPWPRMNPLNRDAPAKPTFDDVAAVIVTRGNVDLTPVLDSLPYPEVVVWDNSLRPHDYKVLGRYAAITEIDAPIVYWQDDDVIFAEHEKLLAEFEPGKLVCNMDQPWVDACGYEGIVGMQGAGSLCEAGLPEVIFGWYLSQHPYDDDLLTEADFVFGVLAPFKRVDLGYIARDFADDSDRLYQQPGQHQRKWRMIERCRAMLLR